MAKKVLLFAPFGQWIVHTQLDCVFGAALKNRGCEVKVLACDGIFDHCFITGVPPEPDRCASCQKLSTEWFTKFKLDVVQMRSLLTPEDWKEAEAWAQAVPLDDLNAEASFFDGKPIARWMRPGTHSMLRTGTIDFTLPESALLARKLVLHGALISRAVKHCLAEFPADISTCYSGSNSYYRVFFELLRDSGARALVHERGSINGSFFIATGIPTYELSIRKPDDWRDWQDIPLSEEQLETVADSYKNRAEGKNTNFQAIHQFKTEGVRIRHRLRLPEGKKIVLAMCSGDWEFGMYSSFGGLSVLWRKQFDWLADTSRLCKENDWQFIIRQHPLGAGKKTYPRATAFLSEMLREYPWLNDDHVRMIMPAENLSSYDLFEIADVVVAQFSRTVAEAYSRGVPALCVTNNTLSHIGLHVLQPGDDYLEILRTNIARSPCVSVDALRLAFRWSHFRFYTLGSSLFESVRIKDVYEPDFRRSGPEDVLPGTDPRLDEICEHLLHGTPLYPAPKTVPSLEAETAWIERYRSAIVDRRLALRSSLTDPADPEVLVLCIGSDQGQAEPYRWRCRHRNVRFQWLMLDASQGMDAVNEALSPHLKGSTAPYVIVHGPDLWLDESAISRAVDALEDEERREKAGVLFGCYALTAANIIGPEWNTATHAPDKDALPPPLMETLMQPLCALSLVLWRREAFATWLLEVASTVRTNDALWSRTIMSSYLDEAHLWNLAEPAVFLRAVPSRDHLLNDAKAYHQRYGHTSQVLEYMAGTMLESQQYAQALPLVQQQFRSGQGNAKAWDLLVRTMPKVTVTEALVQNAVPDSSATKKLGLMQIHTLPACDLAHHYSVDPALLDVSYKTQMSALMSSGMACELMWASELEELGQKTQLVIANDVVSRFRWASENLDSKGRGDSEEWIHGLALEQVNREQPDVLFLTDPVTFDMSFVRKLKQRPKWVIGWHTGPAPHGVDWKGLDLMLSPSNSCLKSARQQGVLDTRSFYPGFSKRVADSLHEESKEYDVVLCDQWTAGDARSNKLIAKLAKSSLSKDRPFRFGIFLATGNPSELPESVRRLNQGERRGLEKQKALRRGKIVLCPQSDDSSEKAWYLNIFEATGVGCCLLTAQNEELEQFFSPGIEVTTFKGFEDCLTKVHDLLDHPDKAEALAKAGQDRCLSEHESRNRMTALLALLKHKPSRFKCWTRRLIHRLTTS